MKAIVAGIVSAVLLSALTVIRLAGKRAVRKWGPDDAFVAISFVLALITIGLSIYSKYNLYRPSFAARAEYMNAHSVVLWLGPTHLESPRRAGTACARIIVHRDSNLPHTHGPHQDIYRIALPWYFPIQGLPGGSMGGCQLHRRFWLCHGDVCHIHVQSS